MGTVLKRRYIPDSDEINFAPVAPFCMGDEVVVVGREWPYEGRIGIVVSCKLDTHEEREQLCGRPDKPGQIFFGKCPRMWMVTVKDHEGHVFGFRPGYFAFTKSPLEQPFP